MCTRRGNNQAVGWISMETGRKRIGSNYDVHIQREQRQHSWIGRVRNPIREGHWEVDTLSGMQHLGLP
jgi:hypothetical protein